MLAQTDEPVDPLAAGQGDEANAKTAAFFSILGFGASSALLRCGVNIVRYGLSEGSERGCLRVGQQGSPVERTGGK